MPKYSLILSDFISSTTKIKVFELQKNGVSLFDNFFEQIKSNIQRQNSTVAALKYVEQSANLIQLPRTKFRELKGLKCDVKVYEAKKDDIRIYCFQDNKGRVIVVGGVKTKQDKDIQRVQNIIIEYLKQGYDEK